MVQRRLEAATSRLEDLAAEGSPQSQSHRGNSTPDEPTPHVAAATEDASLSSAPPKPAPAPAIVEDPQSVVAFDELVIEGKFKPFLALTKSFAPPSVIEQVQNVTIQLE